MLNAKAIHVYFIEHYLLKINYYFLSFLNLKGIDNDYRKLYFRLNTKY